MRKIIINGRFLTQKVTGVQRYAREIVAELDKLSSPGEIELAIPPDTEKVPECQNITVKRIGRLTDRKWEHISFPRYVHREGAISLNLCNVSPLFSPGIVCIHDVRIKAAPQDYNRKFVLWYNLLFMNAAKRAKAIITVSEFSKKEIYKYYNVKPEKIHVIPNAWQHYERIEYDENALKKYDLKKEQYFFAMCSLEPNKNFKWIAEVAKRYPEHVFAVSGSVNKSVFADGWEFDSVRNMKFLGYVTDEEAKTLMRDCKAFLFPTFYEGFGIPPLEAISAGARQIVVSDTEVMHEVYGDGVIYVDPYDYEFDFSGSVLKKSEYIEWKDILNKYSWNQSAIKLHQVLEGI